MKAGYCGTFVISWAQTEVDGIMAAPTEALTTGCQWRWSGEAVRIDGPADLLVLTGAEGDEEVRRSAARTVRRLMGAAISGHRLDQPEPDLRSFEQGFTVTDGRQAYVVTVIEMADAAARLLMFTGHLPPKDTEMWVVDRALETVPRHRLPEAPAVICFTAGTRILTPGGVRAVESLRPGDRVSTRDDGAQEILWIGGRRMSGARLYAMPELRPIRFGAGALGIGRPEDTLLVSPHHRMLVRGQAARALFNEPEVLVAARDLVNGGTIRVQQGLREVSYIHLLLDRHQILRANGLDSESFHPGSTTLEMIALEQRAGLLALMPGVFDDPASYGAYARRSLQRSEAAILRHDLAA